MSAGLDYRCDGSQIYAEDAMRVLVTWGSKRGGTEGIGRLLGEGLNHHGFETDTVPADKVRSLDEFDAVIVGGALYGNRWPGNVRHFVSRHVDQLRKVPVWFFSSGPLDDSAGEKTIPPTTEVSVLAERVGARGHVTFGGRLEPDAKGFPATAMAKTMSGDWRDPDHIRAWADSLADELPAAKPGRAIDHPAYSVPRLLGYGAAAWTVYAVLRSLLSSLVSTPVAVVAQFVVAPIIFSVVAWWYFHARGARPPLPTAVTWTAIAALLDALVIAGVFQGSPRMFQSIPSTWIPLSLAFLSTWVTGTIMSTMPWPKASDQPRREHSRRA